MAGGGQGPSSERKGILAGFPRCHKLRYALLPSPVAPQVRQKAQADLGPAERLQTPSP